MFITALHRRRLHKIIRDGLVHWWPFDEGSGATTEDVIGGYDFTLSSATWSTDGGENIIVFDGINDYLYPSSLFQVPQSEGTLAVLWKPTEALTGVIHPIIRARDLSPTRLFDIYADLSGDNSYYAGWVDQADDDRIINTPPPWSSGTWYWLFLTWKASVTTKLYTDGVLEATGVTHTADWNTTIADYINVGGDTSNYAKMDLKGMRFYNRSLSTDEMLVITAGQG